MTEAIRATVEVEDIGRPRLPVGAALRLIALLALAAIVLLPLVMTVLDGFKTLGELHDNPIGLPRVWLFSNYWEVLSSARYWQVLANSLIIALATVALTLATASMAAFVFAHIKFFGDRYLFAYVQLGLLFPTTAAILPVFIKVRNLGLLDTYWGVILPQVAFSLSMAVLLLRNAFRQLPVELFDAALIDGCGYFRFFRYVTLPLSGPILSTVAVIAFVSSWNGYLLPLVVLDSERRYPWTLGLMDYQGQYSTSWQLVLAFITLTILPAVVMFLLAQRYIVAGLTAGAVKG